MTQNDLLTYQTTTSNYRITGSVTDRAQRLKWSTRTRKGAMKAKVEMMVRGELVPVVTVTTKEEEDGWVEMTVEVWGKDAVVVRGRRDKE